MGGAWGGPQGQTDTGPTLPATSRVCCVRSWESLPALGADELGGGPLTAPDQQRQGCRQTSREARQALYWRICHRHADTHRPWPPRAQPGTSPGARTADTGDRLPTGGRWLLLEPTTVPSLLAGLPRGPWEKSQPSGDSKGRGAKGGFPDPPRLCPSLTLTFSSCWLGCEPQVTEQVQGPRATLWGLVSIHPSSGLLQGIPDGQCGKGHGCQVWGPLQSPERTPQVGGEGRGGRSGQELQQRPVPCPGALWSPLPAGAAAQAGAPRARTCTLGRRNQEGGSPLLELSSWKRMRRKKSPVQRNRRAPRQADWPDGRT